MDYLIMILRTLFISIIILFVLRRHRRRDISELSVLDFVVIIMIAELGVTSIQNRNEPLLQAMIPIVILVIVQFLYASLASKNEKMQKRMSRIQSSDVNVSDEMLNKQTHVEFAFLQSIGKQSMMAKNDEDRLERKAPLPLIINGKVLEDQLLQINQTSLWLRQQLRQLGYRDVKKISYCALKGQGTFFIDLKED